MSVRKRQGKGLSAIIKLDKYKIMLPVYLHPTLAVFVDDSPSFLESLTFQLGQRLQHMAFQDPVKALAWLRQSWHQHSMRDEADPLRIGFEEEGAILERRQISIFLDRIYSIVTDKRRFSLPSVVVVDYAMPQMNGVEFCNEIKGLPIKKILLTGQADDKVAVEAFNRGLIDCFVRKSDPGALEGLGGAIARLQSEFFQGYTCTLKDLLVRHTYAFLLDPEIEALVQELSSRYRFVEHYLFPNPPGILFVDKLGKTTLMVIETATGLTAQYEIAEDQGAPPELLNALRDHKLVPFFSDTGGMYLKEVGKNWLSYCLPPQVCQGGTTYYWALFDLPARFLQGPVYSQEDFLKDQSRRA